VNRQAALAALLATMAALMTAPSLASTLGLETPAPAGDAADPSMTPGVADGQLVPAETSGASVAPPASADPSDVAAAQRMPVDPFVITAAIGLALGLGLAAGWLAAMRRAHVAHLRDLAAAQSRASAAIEQRTLRRARSRSSADPIVDAPVRRAVPKPPTSSQS
jgi:hypothetical protein